MRRRRIIRPLGVPAALGFPRRLVQHKGVYTYPAAVIVSKRERSESDEQSCRPAVSADEETPLKMPSRRRFLHLAAGSPAMAFMPAAVKTAVAQVVEDDHLLKPGQFTWHPDRSPVGPVSIIVSIPDQLVNVYRNGIRIG